jgi:hypothetical protein
MRAMGRRRAPLAAVLVACLGCGAPAVSPLDADPDAPLAALPPCGDLPAGSGQDVLGVELPEEAIVEDVTEEPPLITVTGYAPRTPVQIRRDYAERDDLEVFFIEDEIYESEAMVGNGTHRTYVKATAVCDRGSRLLMVVAPELDAAGLPVPATASPGQPSP